MEKRSLISLLSDDPDLVVRVHDLSQELASRSSEVSEDIRRQVDTLQTLFSQGLSALTQRIQVAEKLATTKRMNDDNKAARAAFLNKTQELDLAISAGQAKTLELNSQIQQLETQLAALRAKRDALEATTQKLVETRMAKARDAGPIYKAFEKCQADLATIQLEEATANDRIAKLEHQYANMAFCFTL